MQNEDDHISYLRNYMSQVLYCICTQTQYSVHHRIRMETEAEANNRRCFLGENGRPLRFCSRRIDTGGPVQHYRNQYFDFSSTDKLFSILSGSSVVALWIFNLKEAGSNLLFLPFCILQN